jgi:hypothetical protein
LQIIQLCGIEEALGVQTLVPEKLVQIAVKRVGTGLGDDVNHGAGVASVLRIERIGQDAKLLDTVRRRLDGRQVGKLIVSVAAIYREIVVAAAAAVHADDSGAIAAVQIVDAKLRLYARLQLQQLVRVPLRQRQFTHGALSHHCAQLRGGRIHERRRARNFDRFRCGANL